MIEQLNLPEPVVWPTSLSELEHSERLVVWALRRWALAVQDHTSHHICLVLNEFTKQFGTQDARAAMACFVSILGVLQETAKRNLHHHQPGCPCLGVDEVWLVCLVGSCQRGEPRQARFLAEQMVREDGVGPLLAVAEHLGRAMRAHALLLPYRDGKAAPAGTMSLTIH